MKYRILETYGYFYPQFKEWFTWKYFTKFGGDLTCTIQCKSYEDARDFIAEDIQRKIELKYVDSKRKIHPYV